MRREELYLTDGGHEISLSPTPEGIPLLEAERMAREREPGDGSPPRSS